MRDYPYNGSIMWSLDIILTVSVWLNPLTLTFWLVGSSNITAPASVHDAALC